MVVKGLERNMSGLYEARRLLLGLDSCESAKATQPTPDPTNGLTHYWLSMLLQQLRLAEQGELSSAHLWFPLSVCSSCIPPSLVEESSIFPFFCEK